MTASFDALTNSGEVYQNLKDKGFSDQEITRLMLGSISKELPVDILEGGIEGNTILSKGLDLMGKTWKGKNYRR